MTKTDILINIGKSIVVLCFAPLFIAILFLAPKITPLNGSST